MLDWEPSEQKRLSHVRSSPRTSATKPVMQTKNIRLLPADPIKEADFIVKYPSVAAAAMAGIVPPITEEMLGENLPRFSPLERLPCANFYPAKYKTCPNSGTLACSACKLVSYCSKECQNTHWPRHRIDCKNRLMSTEWQPSYIIEKRLPSYISDGPSYDFTDPLACGASLWGNIPAIDVINSSSNKSDIPKDLSLAFVASGDLRHVLRTINALPHDYSGNINIVINDRCPHTVLRNFLLILVLGSIPDKVLAADIALHFWYSLFMPVEYRLRMLRALVAFLKSTIDKGNVMSLAIGPSSTISLRIPFEFQKLIRHFLFESIPLTEAQDEYNRVRTAPSRHDLRDRMYSKLRPSHRVAFHQYRRFGIVLPFGAPNAHFNVPNASLFSVDGKWLQTDYADPLEGWDLPTAVERGKAHGARAEDIYGCLYFYLSDELRLFAERIQRFRISFNVLGFEAVALSELILRNELATYGIPASIKFDRIEVSNILDNNYVGIEGVLTAWAPLLRKNRSSTIIGYFMNWMAMQPDDSLSDLDDDGLRCFLTKQGKGLENTRNSSRSIGDVFSGMMSLLDDLELFRDNSQRFREFLKKQKLNAILKKTNLLCKQEHTIVPHRIHAPLRGPDSALPAFPDDESLYYETQLHSFTWTERFVEFTVNKVI